MAKKLIITETELREIIKEEIHKTFLKEGIDIDTIGGKRQISVNNSHQDYVDTNNFPKKKYRRQSDGFKSIVKRLKKKKELGIW